MECDSCGRTVAGEPDTCGYCGAASQEPATDRASRPPPLATDGGQGPPDDENDEDDEDDPLADQPGGSAEEPNGDYIPPEDIVDDEDPDELPPEDQPPVDRPDDQQPVDRPDDQPPAGQSGGQAGGEPEDGRPPAGGEPEDGRPSAGGEPEDGRPSAGGEPEDGRPSAGGESEESQPAGQGRPGEAGQPGQPNQAGQPQQPGQPPAGAGGQGAQPGQPGAPLGGEAEGGEGYGGESSLVDELQRYPLKLGTALGMIAFLIPYGLLTLATFWAWEQPPGENYEPLGERGWQYVEGSESWGELDVSAELFFHIAELGSGEAVVDLFRRSAGVARPSEVDPSDYPTAEDELEPMLELLALDAVPDVPLLILFVLAPYIIFISARYLARHHTPGETPFEYAVAGGTATIGTLIVALLLGLVFPVTDFAGRLLFAGILIPGLIGAIGGLSIWAFDDQSALISTLTAWTVIALGIALAVVLVPIPDLGLPDGASLNLSILDRLVLGLGAYLNAAQFNPGSHSQGRLFFLLVILLTIGAGFVRTWQVRDRVADRMDGARVGASIFLGFLGTVALFLWAFPMATVLVDLDLQGGGFFWFLAVEAGAIEGGAGGLVPTIETVTSVDSYFRAVFVAGLVFPMTFGAIGGYLAIWQRDR
jgi:hypothetical protein